jgi:hypothetical protein
MVAALQPTVQVIDEPRVHGAKSESSFVICLLDYRVVAE